MEDLKRVTAKIFASNANLETEDIGQFGSALAGNKLVTGDIATIQALPAFEQGWRGAVLSSRNYPPLPEMAGLQKVLSYQEAYILQKGIPEWDESTTYYKNTSFCQIDGVWFQSLTDNNIGNNPQTDITNWKKVEFDGGGGLVIGEIIKVPANDNYVPENTLYTDGAEYSNTQFNTFYNDYLVSNRLKTVSFDEYNNELTANGYCYSFGLDTATGKFKVPFIPDEVMTGGDILTTITTKSTIPVKGNGMALGVTNGTANAGVLNYTDNTGALFEGNAYGKNVSSTVQSGNRIGGTFGITRDSSKSGMVADLSGAVSANSTFNKKTVKIKHFVVVANQSVEQSAMNWSAWASSLNGKANTDLTNLSPEGEKHFLNKTQISNCILEIPQRINLELSNDGTLTLKSDSSYYMPDGIDKFQTITADSDISFKPAINTNSLVFGIVSNNKITGLDIFGLNTCFSGESEPSAETAIWYDTKNNLLKNRINNGEWESGKFTLPFALVSVKTAETGVAFINQIFNGIGYIGSTIWVDKGIKVLIPDGRNEDGTLKNIEYEQPKIVTRTFTTGSQSTSLTTININKNSKLDVSYRYIKSTEEPTTPNTNWYNPTENVTKARGAVEQSWVKNYNVPIADLSWAADSRVTGIKIYKPFQAADANDIKAYITDTYVNGTSGYRVWSDGYCEQWGTAQNNQEITLLKPYTDANYNAICSQSNTSNYVNGVPCITLKTAAKFNMTAFYADFGTACWKTSGYIR